MAEVSVIVPVYNAEEYLEACVSSILAQTYKDFELILVDDGSTDGSGAICDEYAQKDSRVRVFHKANGGVSSARNLGLQEALGAFIMFADSDDIVDSTWVEKLKTALTSNESDLAVCGYVVRKVLSGAETKLVYDRGNCYIKEKAQILEFWTAFLENRNHMVLSLWNKIFRKDIIDTNNIRFDESLSHSEDALFIFEYLRGASHGITTIDAVGYYYLKRNEETLTSKYKPDYWAVKRRGFSELYETIMQNGIEWKEIEKAFATHINTVVPVAINNALKLQEKLLLLLEKIQLILNSQEFTWAVRHGEIVQVHWMYRFILKRRSAGLVWLFNKAVKIRGLIKNQ